MNVSSITAGASGMTPNEVLGGGGAQGANFGKTKSDPSEVARQFEAILVRQLLTESMKPLLENGKSGQVYGYFLTDALADGITKGGGLGLRSIMETQLRLRENLPHNSENNPNLL